MDRWLIRPKPMEDFSDHTPIQRSIPIYTVFGVLGTRNKISYEEFVEHIMNPIVEVWGLPAEIMCYEEGELSEYFSRWIRLFHSDSENESARPPNLHCLKAEWGRHGKKAGFMRDATIKRDATHLILLQGPRSNAFTTLASSFHKKGKPVVISVRPGKEVVEFSCLDHKEKSS